MIPSIIGVSEESYRSGERLSDILGQIVDRLAESLNATIVFMDSDMSPLVKIQLCLAKHKNLTSFSGVVSMVVEGNGWRTGDGGRLYTDGIVDPEATRAFWIDDVRALISGIEGLDPWMREYIDGESVAISATKIPESWMRLDWEWEPALQNLESVILTLKDGVERLEGMYICAIEATQNGRRYVPYPIVMHNRCRPFDLYRDAVEIRGRMGALSKRLRDVAMSHKLDDRRY